MEGSLIRKITQDYFDVDAMASHAKLSMAADAGAYYRAREMDCKIDATSHMEAQAAGQLPQGFRPGDQVVADYQQRNQQIKERSQPMIRQRHAGN
ncbi:MULTISPECIES: hypothetical protein [Photorhabdus]|uniref:hypothetical protein n=1 Tax=unclassified Photorhabdus TaxID=2620880 RepID=UPI000DCB8545|nr:MULTISPECIES: hypothetical protein [Photorhabdus]MCT8345285.1 hypothetical protein [Photorhabdus kleinii]RAW96218.1 hypothetical protein CKY03_15800 [Photorhabdus sp. S9-53]RAX00152.1 hypothetical protein CKY05_08620 [Photorhabdus sp. S10-54]RAX04486.1 hypothetical protein CKY04_08690 [Photorhabdus sp. S8-52]